MHMYLFFCTNMIFFSFRDEYLWLTWNCPTNHTYSWSVGRNEASPDIAVQYQVSWHDEHHNVNDSSVRRDSGTINSKSEKYHCRLVSIFFTLKNNSQMISREKTCEYLESLQIDLCFFQPCWNPPFSRPLNQNSSNESLFQFPRHLGRRIHRYTREDVFVFAGRMKRRTCITWSGPKGDWIPKALRIPES